MDVESRCKSKRGKNSNYHAYVSVCVKIIHNRINVRISCVKERAVDIEFYK